MKTVNANVVSFPFAQARSPAARVRPNGSTGNAIALTTRRRQRLTPVPSGQDGNAGRVRATAPRALPLGELWAAISEDRIVNHYQPQCDFVSGRTVALEALARLVDRDGRRLTPDRFIAQAEESGIIVPLGRRVIRQACADLARWRARGHALQRVAVNLSAYQLKVDTTLFEFVEQTLDQHGLVFPDLEFELTERQVLEADGPGVDTLRTLASAGSRLALDDFGIGYSSMAYLSMLDIGTVKLDRSMISLLPGDRTNAGVVRHLVAMATELDMDVVAEGIETVAQNEFMAGLGCDLGQGYLIARPMDPDTIDAFLAT